MSSEDIPWMLGVADFGQGINQGTLPFGLECNVESDQGAGRWVALTLPVDWEGVPGVFDFYVMPRF